MPDTSHTPTQPAGAVPGPSAPSEDEAAGLPDAVAGRALLDARLSNLTTAERSAFWEAVGRCFGGVSTAKPGGGGF